MCVYIYAMKSRTNRRQIAQTDKHVIHILQNICLYCGRTAYV